MKVFGSNDKRSETALLHVLSVSLAASWAASFSLALPSGGHPRMQLNSASTGLLLTVARPPCLTCGSDFLQNAARPRLALAVHRLLLNASRLLHLNSAPGFACRLLAAGSSLSAKAHLKHDTCSRYAPSCSGPCASESHCYSAGTSGFVFFFFLITQMNYERSTHPMSRLPKDAKRSCQRQGASCKRAENGPITSL